MIKDFKFLQPLKDYNLHVDNVPMFRVYTHKEITNSIIDELNGVTQKYLFERNTEENRNKMMDELLKYFVKVESIYDENV